MQFWQFIGNFVWQEIKLRTVYVLVRVFKIMAADKKEILWIFVCIPRFCRHLLRGRYSNYVQAIPS